VGGGTGFSPKLYPRGKFYPLDRCYRIRLFHLFLRSQTIYSRKYNYRLCVFDSSLSIGRKATGSRELWWKLKEAYSEPFSLMVAFFVHRGDSPLWSIAFKYSFSWPGCVQLSTKTLSFLAGWANQKRQDIFINIYSGCQVYPCDMGKGLIGIDSSGQS